MSEKSRNYLNRRGFLLSSSGGTISMAGISNGRATASEAKDGVTPEDQNIAGEHAFASALNIAVSNNVPLRLGSKIYNINTPIDLNISRDFMISGQPGSRVNFSIDSESDCIRIRQTGGYHRVYLFNVDFDANNTGRDLISISRGELRLKHVRLLNAGRDGLAFNINGESFDWVENVYLEDVYWGAVGRHAMRISVEGDFPNGEGQPFANEFYFLGCEVRGVGRRFADANILRIEFHQTSRGAKVSGLTFIACNFDGQQGLSLNQTALGDIIFGASSNAGVGGIDDVHIIAGGWETTSSLAENKYILNTDQRIGVGKIVDLYRVPYDWADDYPDKIKLLPSFFWQRQTGMILPVLLPRPNGRSLTASGGLIEGFSNSPSVFIKNQTISSDDYLYFSIKIKPLLVDGAQAPIRVCLTKKGGMSDNKDDQYATYLLWPASKNGNAFIGITILDVLSGNRDVGFYPESISARLEGGDHIMVRLKTGRHVGRDGTSNVVNIFASRISNTSIGPEVVDMVL